MNGWERNKDDVRRFIRAHISEPLRGLKGIPSLLEFWLKVSAETVQRGKRLVRTGKTPEKEYAKNIKTTIISFLSPSDRKTLMGKPICRAFLYVQDIGFRIFARKADGNFQYAKCALEAPQSRNEAPLCMLDFIPDDLEGLYKLRYDAIFKNRMEDFYTFVTPLVEILLASNGPIPEDILLDIHSMLVDGANGKEQYKLRNTARNCFKMVKQLCICSDDKGKGLSFAHKSYADWFGKDGHDYSVDAKRGHKKLTQLGGEQWKGNTPKGKYLLRNGVYHSVHANDFNRARAMMFHFDRLLARARLGPPHALVEDANLTVAAGEHSSNKALKLAECYQIITTGIAKGFESARRTSKRSAIDTFASS